ncbi:phosphatidylserine decarboxylase proenzyme, mitochondrial isoform X2 [Exaiptasia diaphana]|uniref:Phosphatidylserine decarboxylase proenzyme, mitochondrial n=1 Tax=Exaiptasia diaphana TaxID=2652724 RepID=A0A913XWS1_EXADI|nr:phosphatidylserine decarboxylase proenzyme, mitochondrial isoform X2 [Exaiptasia diaphana]XP_020910439.1 phosphatidylserine decarboxylase proenzyme, mitochondrial isoform X2 [Exaiptasia diaphana]XP_020910440.1 phosphatidylserine decarboxylase proenzyme, mitochondrial isoform X2 [Exaiptasia diaphana]XP_020910441.1 phosphatidylserine decarboxylase proenzyme, mitochondrial isoform X2 [Exaiptasia diaphana]
MTGMNCDVRFNTQIVVFILLSYAFFSSCSGPCWSELFGEPHHYSYSGRFTHGFKRYWASLKWFSIPASLGFAYICFQQYGHIKKREKNKISHSNPEELLAKNWQVALYRKIPSRAMSRAFGQVINIDLPEWLRWPIIGLYCWTFSCNLDEAVVGDIKSYPSVGAFFRRELKPETRPINVNSELTSPSDGVVLHFGKVEGNEVEQVKGITYDMTTFLGPGHPHELDCTPKDKTCLYQCVLYLGPGDYHCFHSPADWEVKLRRHFPGDLLSVGPSIQRLIKGLFNYNERVVLSGTWKHGFFSYSAVGAHNVGSIYLDFEPELRTNLKGKYIPGDYGEKLLSVTDNQGVCLKKGEKMGGFNMGSTIVLIFEAPKDFVFTAETGQKIKYGQPLGSLGNE